MTTMLFLYMFLIEYQAKPIYKAIEIYLFNSLLRFLLFLCAYTSVSNTCTIQITLSKKYIKLLSIKEIHLHTFTSQINI